MSKRASVSARVIAVTALVCGVAVLLLVIAGSLDEGGGGGGSGKRVPKGQVTRGEKDGKGSFKGAYVVQNGDTLTSIAHETGVPVSQILRLNPGIDPQILISGEKLKLR